MFWNIQPTTAPFSFHVLKYISCLFPPRKTEQISTQTIEQLRDTTSPTECLPFTFEATSARAAIRGTKEATPSFSISAEDMLHYSRNLRKHSYSAVNEGVRVYRLREEEAAGAPLITAPVAPVFETERRASYRVKELEPSGDTG